MQVIFEKAASAEEELAVIRAVKKNDEIETAIKLLEGAGDKISVGSEGQTYLLEFNKIYYIESIDKKTFVYTKENCYETRLRLYELEEILNINFLRCTKSMIVNIKKIRSVKSDVNGRMNARLLNDEKVVIARSYVKELKNRLGI